VFLERERERGIGTNGGWGGENGNGAAKVAGVFKAGNATSKTTVAVAELGSFGVYFPRSTAQVQPCLLDVTELLRLVEELRERESLLKTKLLGPKLLKESVAIVPVLENEIYAKDAELEWAAKQIDGLEVDNQSLRMDGGDEGEDRRAIERRNE
jgi:hypothetical protein